MNWKQRLYLKWHTFVENFILLVFIMGKYGCRLVALYAPTEKCDESQWHAAVEIPIVFLLIIYLSYMSMTSLSEKLFPLRPLKLSSNLVPLNLFLKEEDDEEDFNYFLYFCQNGQRVCQLRELLQIVHSKNATPGDLRELLNA